MDLCTKSMNFILYLDKNVISPHTHLTSLPQTQHGGRLAEGVRRRRDFQVFSLYRLNLALKSVYLETSLYSGASPLS